MQIGEMTSKSAGSGGGQFLVCEKEGLADPLDLRN